MSGVKCQITNVKCQITDMISVISVILVDNLSERTIFCCCIHSSVFCYHSYLIMVGTWQGKVMGWGNFFETQLNFSNFLHQLNSHLVSTGKNSYKQVWNFFLHNIAHCIYVNEVFDISFPQMANKTKWQ